MLLLGDKIQLMRNGVRRKLERKICQQQNPLKALELSRLKLIVLMLVCPVLVGRDAEGGEVEERSDPAVESALLVPSVQSCQESINLPTSPV